MAFRRFRSRRPVPSGIKSTFGRGTPSLGRGGRLRYVWNGTKVIAELNDAVLRGLTRAQEAAQEYWNSVVWNPELHPYMTDEEKDSARFLVRVTSKNRVQFSISVPAGADGHALYHEFGTKNYEGHFPIRQTIDFIGPRIRGYIADEIRKGQVG